MSQRTYMNEHVVKYATLDQITTFEIWAMGRAWVIPQSYDHQQLRPLSTGVKNGFGLRSGLLSTTHQVQCLRGLCMPWHIFKTGSRDSSEAVLLMYGGLMALILSSWVMWLSKADGGATTDGRRERRGGEMWRAPVANQGDCAGHEELGSAREGMFSPNSHRSIARKITKLLRAKKVTWMLMGEWKTVHFFWDANVRWSSWIDFSTPSNNSSLFLLCLCFVTSVLFSASFGTIERGHHCSWRRWK